MRTALDGTPFGPRSSGFDVNYRIARRPSHLDRSVDQNLHTRFLSPATRREKRPVRSGPSLAVTWRKAVRRYTARYWRRNARDRGTRIATRHVDDACRIGVPLRSARCTSCIRGGDGSCSGPCRAASCSTAQASRRDAERRADFGHAQRPVRQPADPRTGRECLDGGGQSRFHCRSSPLTDTRSAHGAIAAPARAPPEHR